MHVFVTTWLAPGSKRLRYLAIALAAAVFAAVAIFGHPTAASAQYNPLSDLDPDPLSALTGLSNGWWKTGKDLGEYLFTTLLIIEIVIFGVQMALFRDNLGEFFGGLALKILGLGVFFWFLDQADSIFPAIKNSLDMAGGQIVGHDEGSDILAIVGNCGIGIAGLFTVASALHGADAGWGSTIGVMVFGSGDPGAAMSASTGHLWDTAILQFIGFLILTSLVIVILQYVIINAEAFLVLAGGVLFLGFAGSKFTLPFAQGYMSYAINVGAKLLALHLGLAAAAVLSGKVLGGMVVSLAGLVADAVAPDGIGAEILVGTLAYAAFQCVMMAAMVWMIPNLAGAFLSGQSTSSGTQVLSNAAGAAAGAAAIGANLNRAGHEGEKNGAGQGGGEVSHGGHGHGHGSQGGQSPGLTGDASPGAPVPTSLGGSQISGGPGSGGGETTAAQAPTASPMTQGSQTHLGSAYSAGMSSKAPGGGGSASGAPLQAGAPASGSNGSAPAQAGGGPASAAPPTSDTGVAAPAAASAAGSLAASALPASSTAPNAAPAAAGPAKAAAVSTGGGGAGGGNGANGGGATPQPMPLKLHQESTQAQATGGGSASQRDTGNANLDAERDMAIALGGLSQGIPHENAPASAVQVRLGLPEKI